MAVGQVDGYGTINRSNAYEIYTAYKKGEVDLTASQQKRCESFLTDDEINEIDETTYTSETGEQVGKDELGEDLENAESKNSGAVTAEAATMTAVAASITTLSVLAIAVDGFTSVAVVSTIVALAASSIPLSLLYDTEYGDRTQACDNADATDAIIDERAERMIETMDEMNDDMDEYQAQSDNLTTMVNENTSVMADLQIQLATAQSAGDTEGVKSLQEQMKQIQGADFSDQEDGLNDIVDKLDEYGALNDEAMGIAEGGQSISDFLKPGTALGAVATVDAALLLAAGIMVQVAQASMFPKIAPFFVDGAGTAVAKVLAAVAKVSLALSTAEMGKKAAKEFECGAAGNEMQEHVNNLNELISEQLDYIDSTDGTYMDIDEESEESEAEAQEKADKAVESNSGSVGASIGATSDEDKEKEPVV